jgi:hypothetical protein
MVNPLRNTIVVGIASGRKIHAPDFRYQTGGFMYYERELIVKKKQSVLIGLKETSY